MFRKLLIATSIFAGTAFTAAADTDKNVLGWLEHVRIADLDIELDANLDTGAKTSSIHAVILDAPDRKDWDDEDETRDILFKVINEDGDERTIETEIVRWAAIKTKRGGLIHRPVVELEFCLGGLLIEDEVTLADRGNFNYETLIGRNMLEKADIVVDAREIYTKRARCSK